MYNSGMAKSKKYSISEARSNFPNIVREAEAGLHVELSRRGKPVAVVISIQEFERLHGDRPHFMQAYREFLERFPMAEFGLEEGYFESQRSKETGREVSL